MGLKKRRLIIIISTIALGILAAVLAKIHIILMYICIIAICLIDLILWSCPNCGRYLGKSLSLEENQYCKYCGEKLYKYF